MREGIFAALDANAAPARGTASPYDLPRFGNVHLLHMTDCHAQLLPIHFREPSMNLGVGGARGRPLAASARSRAEKKRAPPTFVRFLGDELSLE